MFSSTCNGSATFGGALPRTDGWRCAPLGLRAVDERLVVDAPGERRFREDDLGVRPGLGGKGPGPEAGYGRRGAGEYESLRIGGVPEGVELEVILSRPHILLFHGQTVDCVLLLLLRFSKCAGQRRPCEGEAAHQQRPDSQAERASNRARPGGKRVGRPSQNQTDALDQKGLFAHPPSTPQTSEFSPAQHPPPTQVTLLNSTWPTRTMRR